jgi:hypothetical protein
MSADLRRAYCRFNVWSVCCGWCNSPLALALAAFQFALSCCCSARGSTAWPRLVRFEPPRHLHGGGHGHGHAT